MHRIGGNPGGRGGEWSRRRRGGQSRRWRSSGPATGAPLASGKPGLPSSSPRRPSTAHQLHLRRLLGALGGAGGPDDGAGGEEGGGAGDGAGDEADEAPARQHRRKKWPVVAMGKRSPCIRWPSPAPGQANLNRQGRALFLNLVILNCSGSWRIVSVNFHNALCLLWFPPFSVSPALVGRYSAIQLEDETLLGPNRERKWRY